MMRLSEVHALNGSLQIGDNVSINSNVCIAPCDGGAIAIGNNVLIGQNVVVRAADHAHDRIDFPINQQGHVGGVITIGEGAWVGANVVITRDVQIGAHAIVGAGSVVTCDVPPYSVVGGVPARLLRKRIDNEISSNAKPPGEAMDG